jgi:hypothetical protein
MPNGTYDGVTGRQVKQSPASYSIIKKGICIMYIDKFT